MSDDPLTFVPVIRHGDESLVMDKIEEAEKECATLNGKLSIFRQLGRIRPDTPDAEVEEIPTCEGLTFTIKKEIKHVDHHSRRR